MNIFYEWIPYFIHAALSHKCWIEFAGSLLQVRFSILLVLDMISIFLAPIFVPEIYHLGNHFISSSIPNKTIVVKPNSLQV